MMVSSKKELNMALDPSLMNMGINTKADGKTIIKKEKVKNLLKKNKNSMKEPLELTNVMDLEGESTTKESYILAPGEEDNLQKE